MKRSNPGYVRKFTVSILSCENNSEEVGTGFVISADGKIVSASHVLRDAGVDLGGHNYPEILVGFRDQERRKSEVRKAKLVAYRDPVQEDDVALLQLIDGPSPLGPEDVARLGKAEDSLRDEFISFGFRRIDDYQGLAAEGKIRDFAFMKNININLLCDRMTLNSSEIDSGMSGAPVAVLDEDEAYRVVGIIIATNVPKKENPKDRDTSFAADALVLTYEPFKDHISNINFPDLMENNMPKADTSVASKTISIDLDIAWNGAPSIPDYWVERDELINAMTDCWKDGKTRLMSLICPDGGGKTTLARKWSEDLLNDRWHELPKPKGTFWWSFEDKPNVDEFFESALNYLSKGNIDLSKCGSTNVRMDFLATMISVMEKSDFCLFILDGLNILQHQQRDLYGNIKNEDLRQFIAYLALFGHCLVTSSIPLLDYDRHPSHIQHNINRLSNTEGRKLLGKLGVKGSNDELDKIVNDGKGQPLWLTLSATLLKKSAGG